MLYDIIATSGRLAVAVLPLLLLNDAPTTRAQEPAAAWFQRTEQALMDAIAVGDRGVWDRVMDDRAIVTSEEGEVIPKEKFLEDLRPLPPGLTGTITVKELTVDERSEFAVVRFLADESEIVFGQRLATKYRVTNTYRRDGSGWKMVASHLSVVTADPPAQKVASDGWPGLVGRYQLLPDGWTFHVALRDGQLVGGRDPAALKRLIPLTPTAFVREGSLGEWLFVIGAGGTATHIVNFRKFEPLVWTRMTDR